MTTAQMPHERVAEEVRAVLARKRISGRHAARELGWKPGYMHRRLSGEAPFDVNDLAALAELLDVPVISFFPETITGGGPLHQGVNKVIYSPPHPYLRPVLTCGVESTMGPLPADFSRAA